MTSEHAPHESMQYRQTGPGTIEVQCTDGSRPSVECLMTRYEPLCYEVAAECLHSGARAAEVGRFKGGSACSLWHAMRRQGRDLTLACHDLFRPFEVGGEVHDVESLFDANTAGWEVGAIKVKGDSRHTCAVHPDGSLDYVFIDGDHSYEAALADIRGFIPKLKPTGWLVVQDSIGDVERALADANLEAAGFSSLIITPPFGHYVTVCHRNPMMLQVYHSLLRARMDEATGAGTGFGDTVLHKGV